GTGYWQLGTALLLFDFLQSRRLALELAQIIKLGAADLGGTHHVNLVDDLRVDGKDTLHALAETDFANRKTRLRASRPGNDDAFERLQALFLAFSDLDVYLDGIAGTKLRDVGAARFRQQFFDNRIAHKRFLPNSCPCSPVEMGLAPSPSVCSGPASSGPAIPCLPPSAQPAPVNRDGCATFLPKPFCGASCESGRDCRSPILPALPCRENPRDACNADNRAIRRKRRWNSARRQPVPPLP